MPEQPMLIFLLLFSFSITFIATPVLARFLTTRNVMDPPDGFRKLHKRAIPRLGGVVVFSAVAASVAISLIMPRFIGIAGFSPDLCLRFGPALIIIFLLGLLDDLYQLPAKDKLVVQVCAAAIAVTSGIRFGANAVSPTIVTAMQSVLSVFWLVLGTNAFNLIDGMDGLATGLGLILASTIVLASGASGQLDLLFPAALLAAALLGFLRHNFHPACIFLGDSGSLLIGFMLSCLAITLSNQQTTAIGSFAAVIAFGVPLADVFASVCRRFLRKRPVFSPDHNHIHHRLIRGGLSERQAVSILYTAAISSSAVALICLLSSRTAAIGALIFLGAVAIVFFRALNYPEFSAVSRACRSFSLSKAISSQITLASFQDAVKGINDRFRFWNVVKQACFDFGFDHVRLTWTGHVYEESRLTGYGGSRTSLTISFNPQDSLMIGGLFSPEQHHSGVGSSAFSAFVESVTNEMRARSRQAVPLGAAAELPASRPASVGAR